MFHSRSSSNRIGRSRSRSIGRRGQSALFSIGGVSEDDSICSENMNKSLTTSFRNEVQRPHSRGRSRPPTTNRNRRSSSQSADSAFVTDGQSERSSIYSTNTRTVATTDVSLHRGGSLGFHGSPILQDQMSSTVNLSSMYVEDDIQCKHSVSPGTLPNKTLFTSFDETSIFRRYQEKMCKNANVLGNNDTPSTSHANGPSLSDVIPNDSWKDEENSESEAVVESPSMLVERANHFIAKASVTLSSTECLGKKPLVCATFPQGSSPCRSNPLGDVTNTPLRQNTSPRGTTGLLTEEATTDTSSPLSPESTCSKSTIVAPFDEKKYWKKHWKAALRGQSNSSLPLETTVETTATSYISDGLKSTSQSGRSNNVSSRKSFASNFDYPDPGIHLSILSDDSSVMPPVPPSRPNSLLKLATTPHTNSGRGLIQRVAWSANRKPMTWSAKRHQSTQGMNPSIDSAYQNAKQQGSRNTLPNKQANCIQTRSQERRISPLSQYRQGERLNLALNGNTSKGQASNLSNEDSRSFTGYPVPSYLHKTSNTRRAARKGQNKPVANVHVGEAVVESDEELTAPSAVQYTHSSRAQAQSTQNSENEPDSVFTIGFDPRNVYGDHRAFGLLPVNQGDDDASDSSGCSTMSSSVFDVIEKKARQLKKNGGTSKKWQEGGWGRPEVLENERLRTAQDVHEDVQVHYFAPRYEAIVSTFAVESPSTISSASGWDDRVSGAVVSTTMGKLLPAEVESNESVEMERRPDRQLWIDTNPRRLGGPGGRFLVDTEIGASSCMDLFTNNCISRIYREQSLETTSDELDNTNGACATGKKNQLITPRTASSPDSVYNFPLYSTPENNHVSNNARGQPVSTQEAAPPTSNGNSSDGVRKSRFRFPRKILSQ